MRRGFGVSSGHPVSRPPALGSCLCIRTNVGEFSAAVKFCCDFDFFLDTISASYYNLEKSVDDFCYFVSFLPNPI